MINKGPLSIFFLFILVIYSAQDLRVVYQIDFLPTLKSKEKEKELMALDIRIAAKESVFQSLGGQQIDSINKEFSALNGVNQHQPSFTPPKSSFASIVIKDFNKNEFWVQEKIQFKNYKTPIDFPVEKWKLMEGEEQMFGYVCRRAQILFGGRTWIAYYTLEIPIPDGPYKFYGLPGLILSIKSSDGDYAFTLKSLQRVDNAGKLEVAPATSLSPAQFTKLEEKYMKDPLGQIRGVKSPPGMGVSVSFNGQQKEFNGEETANQLEKELKEWSESHDNFIEKGKIWLK